jgi:hypothetical protein
MYVVHTYIDVVWREGGVMPPKFFFRFFHRNSLSSPPPRFPHTFIHVIMKIAFESILIIIITNMLFSTIIHHQIAVEAKLNEYTQTRWWRQWEQRKKIGWKTKPLAQNEMEIWKKHNPTLLWRQTTHTDTRMHTVRPGLLTFVSGSRHEFSSIFWLN